MEGKPQYFSLEELAQMFRVPKETVVKWVDRGQLSALLVEDDFRVNGSDLDRFIEERKQAAQRVVEAAQYKTQLEERTYNQLYRWMEEENSQLIALFHNLDQSVMTMGETLREEMERSGDRLRARGLREALELLYEKWEATSRSYREWVLDQESRWQRFQSQMGLPLGLSLVPSEELGGTVGTLVDTEALMARTLAGEEPDPYADGGVYAHLYRWARNEHEALTSQYRQVDGELERLINTLYQEARTAGGKLEMELGMAYSDAASVILRLWEGARRSYNQWIIERTDRWSQCRQSIQRDLSALPRPENGSLSSFFGEVGED